MKNYLIAAAAAAGMLIGGLGGSAKADGRWCAFYDHSTYNCGFHSYQQCLDTIRGVGGSCRPNPFQRGRRGQW